MMIPRFACAAAALILAALAQLFEPSTLRAQAPAPAPAASAAEPQPAAASKTPASTPTPAPREIPAALKPWSAWATWNDRDRDCPPLYSDGSRRICVWPSRLSLQVEKESARFEYGATVYAKSWLSLPGSGGAWPQEVKANGNPVPVIERGGAPAIQLEKGTYKIEGAYRWAEIPQNLALPAEIGILSLTLEGQPVEMPVWDAKGLLWLKRTSSTEEADKDFLSVKIYAALEDGIPLWLRTQIELTVAGKSREEQLGAVLPEGWKLSAIQSPIPVAIDQRGVMKVQVRPGKWTLQVDAFRFDNPKELVFEKGVKPAVDSELIGFRAQPDFRTVEITGATSIDVSQTTYPVMWRDLPVYRWEFANAGGFRLEERLRGMGERKNAGVSIERWLWLDENGGGYTFRDFIGGRMQQIWRLDTAAGQDLGSVRHEEQGQLITRNPSTGASGVEIRMRPLALEATGRIAQTPSISASGWQTDAENVKVTLNLPPGWRLFALFGADWVHGDWLTAWSLLDLFLLLLFGLAVFRLWGWWMGLLALAAFALSYHEPGAPRLTWLFLLVPLAILRVVPEGRGRLFLQWWKGIAVLVLVLVTVPFIARQVQDAIYPQLEFQGSTSYRVQRSESYQSISAPAAAPESREVEMTQRLHRKLEGIIIPKIEFRDATLREAIDFLKQKSVSLDTEETDPTKKGVNIVLRLDSGTNVPGLPPPPPGAPVIPGLEPVPGAPPPPGGEETRITVSLTNIPLGEALRYVTGLANMKYKVEQYAIAIVPQSMPTDSLVTKEYNVPPGFLAGTTDGADVLAPPSGRGGDLTRSGPGIVQRKDAKDYLMASGVTFPPGASVLYLPSSNKLIVKNTQENLDLVDALTETAGLEPPAGRDNLQYESKARIQTGPGVPEWSWRTVTYGWNGPVQAGQQVRPILISLGLERVLMLLRVALTLALAALLLRSRGIAKTTGPGVVKAAAAALLVFLAPSAWGQTPIPSEQDLRTLRERLLETSDAFPHAADIPSASLTLDGRKAVMEAEIHAATRAAVPLPGKIPLWAPLAVTVDGQPQPVVRRDGGWVWVVLDEGIHHVHVEAMLADVSDWEWSFQLKPHRVKIQAPGWTIKGVKPGGIPEQQVFFTREQKLAAGAVSYDRPDLQSVAKITRHLEIGLLWQVTTHVERLSPPGKAIALRVPLLPGERVVSNTAVKDGSVEIRLGAQESLASWESTLPVVPEIKLSTRPDDTWVERWELVVSPVWNVKLSGLPAIFESTTENLVPVWQPWPGESASFTITRPEAIAGATMTVSRGAHLITLGRRQRTSSLELAIRSSVGQDFPIALEPEAQITSLTHEGRNIPVRKDGARLVVPLQPGEQSIVLAWKTNTDLRVKAQGEEVRLPVPAANLNTTIQVPDDRWVLWAGGPRRGPAVRFWGVLALALLASIVLSRVPRSPLRMGAWLLLAIGLTQAPLAAALVVVGWLFILAWRGSDSGSGLSPVWHNLLQVFLILLTLTALGILVFAVGEGLLGRPEMFIAGNESTLTQLRWFQPQTDGLLPRPHCLSVSIWWYRLLMLLWALWLAASLIRWLQWAWQNFSRGGVFRRRPAPMPATPAAAAGTTPPPPPPPAPAA